jgi:hypothetical protein
MPSVEANLEKLHIGLALYVRASGMSFSQVLAKKSKQLGYALRDEFRALMPGKGSVRSQRLDALKQGEGVHVRQSVYDAIAQKYGALPLAGGIMRWRTKGGTIRGTDNKGLNLQALAVKAELNLRESGRGFLGRGAKFVGWPEGNDVSAYNDAKAESRYGAYLAKAGLKQTGSSRPARVRRRLCNGVGYRRCRPTWLREFPARADRRPSPGRSAPSPRT